VEEFCPPTKPARQHGVETFSRPRPSCAGAALQCTARRAERRPGFASLWVLGAAPRFQGGDSTDAIPPTRPPRPPPSSIQVGPPSAWDSCPASPCLPRRRRLFSSSASPAVDLTVAERLRHTCVREKRQRVARSLRPGSGQHPGHVLPHRPISSWVGALLLLRQRHAVPPLFGLSFRTLDVEPAGGFPDMHCAGSSPSCCAQPLPSWPPASSPGAVRLARSARLGGRRLLLPLGPYRHRSPSTPSAAVPPFSDSASRPSSTSSRPRLPRYAPRREHLHARRRPSIPELVRGTHSRRGASCERRSTDFGAHPRNRGQCCTPPNAPLALGAVPFFRVRRRVGSSGLGWIPDGIGDTRSHQGGPSGHGAFFQHASRAIGHRDGAASSSASSWAPSVAPALFPNVPPASVGRGEAFDPDTRKRRARRPLSRQCSSSTGEGRAVARTPGAAPFGSTNGQSAAPGDPVPNNPASTPSCCGEYQALARRLSSWSQRPRRRSPRDFTVTQSKE